ncbi:hypothetical protein HDE76_002691 [Rhodanobacter sp. ANJX3]|uniref:DUF6311 domain-containing protein n=1 Tax=Rhodanobacter sp. ANJX3 TaxID=2723083 RepID=UPI001612490E|nr:DUF6311 domain-containing protein [Rhodanobacter sp. ANJX3]MBB5359462.1 hypothetical protein [Rhodanobacter sp. ANJX3]
MKVQLSFDAEQERVVQKLALVAALTGAIVFTLLLDPSIVDPFRIGWLASGDPAQSYLGWLFFRHEPWSLPLGLTHTMGMEQAGSIVYSDSIPLLAITFKLLRAWLPEAFQYHGLWLCACYALQGYFALRLLALFTSRRSVLVLGVLLFLLSPIMLFRAQWHLALTAHWFIVAALYLYYAPPQGRRTLHWLALLWLAPLVHAYLMFMVYAIWAAYLLRYGVLDRRWSIGRVATAAVLSVAGSVSIMWLAGYFLDMDVSSGGFGYFSMNLLAPFSWIGAGPVLPNSPQGATSGQYEGFNHLGMGILMALMLGIFHAIATHFRQPGSAAGNWQKAPELALILSCAVLTLLAISNEVTLGSRVLFVLPMSAKITSAMNVFRASGRLFWPVYYLLMLAAVRSTLRFSRPVCIRVLLLFFVVQLFDLFPFYHAINRASTATVANSKFPVFPSAFWAQARSRYANIYVIPGQYKDGENIAYESLAGAHGFAIDTAYAARLPAAALQEPRQIRHERFFEGLLDPNGLYLMQSSALGSLKTAQRLFPPDTGMGLIDGMTIVAPGWFKNASAPYLHRFDINDFADAAIGETCVFGKDGNGIPYMLAGWGEPGDDATWSVGPSAILAFHVPPGDADLKIVLNVDAYLPEAFPHLTVNVDMNGHRLARWQFERGKPPPDTTLPLPSALNQTDGNIALRFTFDQARSPSESGESVDARKLALLLRSASIQRK